MVEARVPTTDPKGWSQETAIDYLLAVISGKHDQIQAVIAGNDRRYEERFAAVKEAVLKAEGATEKRFESVNEFRGTLDNQQRTLIPRSEVDEIRNGLEEKIANLTKLLDEVRTQSTNRTAERRGIQGGWGYAVGVVGLVLAILGLASRFMTP